MAVYKPAGLLVHRSAIDRRETRFALQLVRDQLGHRVFPLHRIDKPTAGILLFALDRDTARRHGELVQARPPDKRYLAVVRGHTGPVGEINYSLREQQDRMTDRLADQDKAAQPAVSRYRTLEQVEIGHPVGPYATARYSLLGLQPLTGRKHQLRRHLKHIFHPIVGDTTHGDGRHNAFVRDYTGRHRLMLAAVGLVTDHVHTGTRLAIQAPLDAEFVEILRRLGFAGSGWPDE